MRARPVGVALVLLGASSLAALPGASSDVLSDDRPAVLEATPAAAGSQVVPVPAVTLDAQSEVLSEASATVLAARRAREQATRSARVAVEAAHEVGPRTVWVWPADGRLTSSPGMRIHPISGREKCHEGLDVAAPYGTPIRVVAEGRIVFAARDGGYGRKTVVAHGGGLTTVYAHQARIDVIAGQSVEAGQVIGAVGSSGASTGSHLHLEVRLSGVPYDPLAWFDGSRRLAC